MESVAEEEHKNNVNTDRNQNIQEIEDFDKLEKNIVKSNTISNDYDLHGNLNEPIKNFNK